MLFGAVIFFGIIILIDNMIGNSKWHERKVKEAKEQARKNVNERLKKHR